MSTLLSSLYFFQNPSTKKPSSSAVSLKQLCRIICPQKSTHEVLPTGSSTKANSSRSLITASTAVIGFDPIENKYAKAGWVPAKDVAVLREACSSWFFEGRKSALEQSSVIGPISCRELAAFYHCTDDDESTKIHNDTRVWSPELASSGVEHEWKKISELSFLRSAIEAFEGVVTIGFDELLKVDRTNQWQSQQENCDEEEAQAQDEDDEESRLLDCFFSSTAENTVEGLYDNYGEEYESDGGTSYMKDLQSGMWLNSKSVVNIHAANQTSKKRKHSSSADNRIQAGQTMKTVEANKKINKKAPNAGSIKKKKPNFRAKNAKCWVYVTGLPHDTDEEEVAIFFSKAGILDLDPESQKPKVKLYRHTKDYRNHNGVDAVNGGTDNNSLPFKIGSAKGDASICYARAESVDLAIQLLDDAPFRTVDSSGKYIQDEKVNRITVQRAKFEQHGNIYHRQKHSVSNAKRKVARVAILQAVGWDDGENGRITGGLKGLCIVVLKHMFDASNLVQMDEEKENEMLKAVETNIRIECEKWGHVEKITIFSKHPHGIVIVKFKQTAAASKAIEYYNGKEGIKDGPKIEAMFWDGVTDFTTRNHEKDKKEMDDRLDAFGNWLDEQDLPEELKLQIER